MPGSQIVGTWRDKTIQAQIRRERSGEGTALSLPIPRAFFCITFYCTTIHYYLGDWNRRSLGLHSIPLILVSCSSRLAEAFEGPFPKIPAGWVTSKRGGFSACQTKATGKRATKNTQPVTQQWCKTSWITMMRVLPHISNLSCNKSGC